VVAWERLENRGAGEDAEVVPVAVKARGDGEVIVAVG
jgi:hypothetical protein